MEGNRKEIFEEIEKFYLKIEYAMEMSNQKQENINKMKAELREETRIVVVEETREKIKGLEEEKKEFDGMTENSLIEAYNQIKEAQEKFEKEYQEKLLETLEKKKEIQRKAENMKKRDLSPEKMQWAKQSEEKALNNVNEEMKNFQEDHFDKRNKLDLWKNQITDWAIEIGCEDKLETISVEKTEGTVTKPEGTVTKPEGTVTKPEGTVTKPEGTVTKPEGTVTKPEGTVTKPEGTVTKPEGTVTKPEGTVTKPEGTVTKPEGTVTKPEGTVTKPKSNPNPIKNIRCQVNLGMYFIERANGEIQQFEAKVYSRRDMKEIEGDPNIMEILNNEKDKSLIETYPGDVPFSVVYGDGKYDNYEESLEEEFPEADKKTKKFLTKVARSQKDYDETCVMMDVRTRFQKFTDAILQLFAKEPKYLPEALTEAHEKFDKINGKSEADKEAEKQALIRKINEKVNKEMSSNKDSRKLFVEKINESMLRKDEDKGQDVGAKLRSNEAHDKEIENKIKAVNAEMGINMPSKKGEGMDR